MSNKSTLRSFLVYFYSLPPMLYGTDSMTMEKTFTADLGSQASNNMSTTSGLV
jgi:hypothetical protein